MKIAYQFPFKRNIVIDDDWPVPFRGGTLSVFRDNGVAKGLRIEFTNQSTDAAPRVIENPSERIKLQIQGGSDGRFSETKNHLQNAFAYLECLYNIDLDLDHIDIKFEPESEDERAQIDLLGFSLGQRETPLPLTYDMITRAVMAAENGDGPIFEATLMNAARSALFSKKYIDSFRYSFLLIESLFGDGKYQNKQLKHALKADRNFREMVARASRQLTPYSKGHKSDTADLIQGPILVDDIIDHLVEKRGFYFHGNRKRNDAWAPERQSDAEALALLAVDIIQEISAEATRPIFVDELARRHFDNAVSAGASLLMRVTFHYRVVGDDFDQEKTVDIRVPGTKPTGRMALSVVQQALKLFEHNRPDAALRRAVCIETASGQEVFSLDLFVETEFENAGKA